MEFTDKDPMPKTNKTDILGEDTVRSVLDKMRKKRNERKMQE